jgi:hypothetical protein
MDASANTTTTLAGTFTTQTIASDTTAPSFVASTPSNAATAVSVNSGSASIKYSENLLLLDASKIRFENAITSVSSASGIASVSTDSVILNYNDLEYGTTYKISVLSGALSDTVGNVVTGDREIYFTTQSASAPDITSLSISSISSSQATLSYTTDVTPTTSQYRISSTAYSGTWTTLTASPFLLQSLQANTTYYYQVRFTKNGQTVNSVPMSFKTASSSTGIVITQIARIPHGDPVV